MQYFVNEEWLENPLRVLLVGVGGTGSEVLDGLARLHMGLTAVGHPAGLEVTVMDADTVSTANIGRQRFAPCDVGQNKAVTLVSRYNLFYGLAWEGLPLDLEDIESATRRQDIVVTCVDRASVRTKLGQWAASRRAHYGEESLWLDFGNGRTTGQVVLGHLMCPSDAKLRLPNVFDLYPELAGMRDEDGGPSCSMAAALREQDLFVNKWAALGVGLLWQLLTSGSLDRHGFFFDSAALSVNPLRVDPAVWSFMGNTEDTKREAA